MLIFYRYSKSGCKEKKNKWMKQKIYCPFLSFFFICFLMEDRMPLF